MGPTALFDKSFLQSLSVDESVWFDNFFIPVICPLFYVETLGDLDKNLKNKKSPEKLVQSIAKKFPETSGAPCAFHIDIAVNNLLGMEIPMDGRIPSSRVTPVKDQGEEGLVIKSIPEAEAFFRWQRGEFMEVEKSFARFWRTYLASLDLNKISHKFKALGIGKIPCNNLEEAAEIAKNFVSSQIQEFEKLRLCFIFLNLHQNIQKIIIREWRRIGRPPLSSYAPYAAYVLKLEVFFQLAVNSNLISGQRSSNRIDIGYLFYLPFCQIFISNDKLHQSCAPFFLRDNQEFIWGPNLKKDLAELNKKYMELPEEVKEKGIMHFAYHPPNDKKYLVTRLWDKHLQKRRNKITKDRLDGPQLTTKIIKTIELANTPTKEKEFTMPTDPQFLITRRKTHKKRGSWWQVPKNIDTKEPTKNKN